MTTHSFDIKIASEVGVNAAVIYANIQHWAAKNRANGKHFYDGQYWTYNSISAFEELFPYLSTSQIRTALDKLIDAELIRKGNFNQAGYDRTLWYCDLRHFHLSEIANGFAENREPIPDNKPDNKPDISSAVGFDEFWEVYNHKKGKEAALKVWKRKNLSSKAKEVIAGAKAYVKTRGDNPQFFKMAQGWLNDGRWQDHSTAKPEQEIDWADRVRLFEEKGIWPMSYGPRPGMGGCRAPAELIKQQEGA